MDKRAPGHSIPEDFLTWVEKPLSELREAVEAVPLRLSEHQAWLKVFVALGNAESGCRELHKLAHWTDGALTRRGSKWRKRSKA